MRLIDAAPMLEQLDLEHYDKDWYVSQYNADWIFSWLESQPVIDAEPVKHGRWIGTADGYADGELIYDIWECSECGYDADGADEKPNWNYCPNCGCKMDLEET